MLDVNLKDSDISGASENSNVDENWKPGNSLLQGDVEEWDHQGTAKDHHQALLHNLGPHTKLSGKELSDGMQLNFLRYLVPRKFDVLCEILTPIGRTITPLEVYES